MMTISLEKLPSSGSVARATIRSLMVLAHMISLALVSSRSQQVICTNCNKVSNQYENMMDLTVEIHGDASSLEECLDQFTVKEWLHGENMYKCDGCNDYVKAWKRLTIRWAPNILTIALKRFQSGRFGKLNKRVSFPETLDLTPYMSEDGDDSNVYKLYAVVVHVDMLNASFFGHYICYTKDFSGNWYRIDDCKVARVELEEVLSEGAYMLLYSRVSPRQSCLRTSGINAEAEHCSKEQIECVPVKESNNSPSRRVSHLSLNGNVHSEISRHEVGSSTGINTTSSLFKEESFNQNMLLSQIDSEVIRINGDDRDTFNPIVVRENVENAGSTSSQPCSLDMDVSNCDKATISEAVRGAECIKMVEMKQQCSSVSKETKSCEQDSRVAVNYVMKDSEDMNMANSESSPSIEGNKTIQGSAIEEVNVVKRAESTYGSLP